MPAEGPARYRELLCVGTELQSGCGDTFQAPVRRGPPPTRCPDCRDIRKEFSGCNRRNAERARKLARLPAAISCKDCGRPIEGYRPGITPGGVPQRCLECRAESEKAGSRQRARKSYERKQASRANAGRGRAG